MDKVPVTTKVHGISAQNSPVRIKVPPVENFMGVEQRLDDGTFARAVGSEQKGDRAELDTERRASRGIGGSDSLKVLDLEGCDHEGGLWLYGRDWDGWRCPERAQLTRSTLSSVRGFWWHYHMRIALLAVCPGPTPGDAQVREGLGPPLTGVKPVHPPWQRKDTRTIRVQEATQAPADSGASGTDTGDLVLYA